MLLVSAAVPKSSHFGIFGILKHKLGLSSGHKKTHKVNDPCEVNDDVDHEYMEEEVLESPLVARIRCEEGLDGDPGSPTLIRRKVYGDILFKKEVLKSVF